MMIACALVKIHGVEAAEAAKIVRRDRLGTIQRQSQMDAISDYEHYLQQRKVSFALLEGDHQFTVKEYIARQVETDGGTSPRNHKWKPKILTTIFDNLVKNLHDNEARNESCSYMVDPGNASDSMWLGMELQLYVSIVLNACML